MSISFEKRNDLIIIRGCEKEVDIKVNEKSIYSGADFVGEDIYLTGFLEPSYIEVEEDRNKYYSYYDSNNHILLLDNDNKQLAIKYNPELVNFKQNYVDTITQTLGNFPIITRKGGQNYKTFTLGGLLSYELDNDNCFISSSEVNAIRNNIRSSYDQNVLLEKIFRDRVASWLQNGEEKTFYSDQEGRINVYLSNFSWSSEKTLNRVIYSFSCTATEANSYSQVNFGLPGLYIGEEQIPWNTLVNRRDILVDDGEIITVSEELTGELILPNSITAIAEKAFVNCKNLNSITIGQAVNNIGAGAFFNCVNLKKIKVHQGNLNYYTIHNGKCLLSVRKELICSINGLIPNEINKIKAYVFSSPQTVTELIIPDTVTAMEHALLSGCSYLQYLSTPLIFAYNALSYMFGEEEYPNSRTVTLTDGITKCYIPKDLTKLTISGTSIPQFALYNSGGRLKNINIKYGISTLENNALYSCQNIKSLIIPDSVTRIGGNSLGNCISLQELTLPFIGEAAQKTTWTSHKNHLGYIFGVKEIKETASENFHFHDEANSKYYHFNIPTSLTKINVTVGNKLISGIIGIVNQSLRNCSNLQNINLPKTIYKIEDYALYNCSSLKNINLKDLARLSIINTCAMKNCSALESLTIPQAVTIVGNEAFAYCGKLIEINFNAEVMNSLLENNGVFEYAGKDKKESDSFIVNIGSKVQSIPNWLFCPKNDNSQPFYPRITKVNFKSSQVTSLGAYAFYLCQNLETTILPASLSLIGQSAFSKTGLKEIIIPSRLRDISRYSFAHCDSLETLIISEGVEIINADAFYNCDILNSVTLPDSLTTISNYAFGSCEGLNYIKIPKNVNNIMNSAFAQCSGLTKIDIVLSNDYYTVRDDNIIYSKNMQELVLYPAEKTGTGFEIPSTVKKIKGGAFNGSLNLTAIVIPNTVEEIEANAFMACSNLTSVTFTAGSVCKSIGDYAFFGCYSLESITIPDSVKDIGYRAFYRCSKLTLVTIGNGVESIDEDAFAYCSSLTSVTIPNSVTKIDNFAFYDCTALTTINFNAMAMEDLEYNNYVFSNAGKGSADGITVSIGADVPRIPAYLLSPFGGNDYAPKIKEITFNGSVQPLTIGKSAFRFCNAITSVAIPSRVELIEELAFASCPDLMTITVAEENTAYKAEDDGILYSKDGTTLICCPGANSSVTIPDTVTTINTYAFRGCKNLTSIDINEVTTIGPGAFTDCTGLQSVTLSNVTTLGNNAFSWCTSLANVYITDLAKWYNINFGNSYANPLYYGGKLYLDGETPVEIKDLVIPDGVTQIKDYAFYGCSSLTSVMIPASVTDIGNYAFYGCNNLTSGVYITDLAAWCNIDFGDEYANPLYYARSLYLDGDLITELDLRGISLPSVDSGTRINPYSFCNCNFTKLILPTNCKKIGAKAFCYCRELTSVVNLDSVTLLYDYCFYDTGLSGTINLASDIQDSEQNQNSAIRYCVFGKCTSLQKICIDENNESYFTDEGVLYKKSDNGHKLLCYPSGKNDAEEYEVPNDVTILDSESIRDNPFLKKITLPESLEQIGSWTFYGCSNLNNIIIPKETTQIGKSTFVGCSKLNSIIFKQTNNWFYTDDISATSGTTLSSDDLENDFKAVRYLTVNYKDYYWKRREE